MAGATPFQWIRHLQRPVYNVSFTGLFRPWKNLPCHSLPYLTVTAYGTNFQKIDPYRAAHKLCFKTNTSLAHFHKCALAYTIHGNVGYKIYPNPVTGERYRNIGLASCENLKNPGGERTAYFPRIALLFSFICLFGTSIAIISIIMV